MLNHVSNQKREPPTELRCLVSINMVEKLHVWPRWRLSLQGLLFNNKGHPQLVDPFPSGTTSSARTSPKHCPLCCSTDSRDDTNTLVVALKLGTLNRNRNTAWGRQSTARTKTHP